jgi:flagellar motor switch protein FliG
MGVYTRFKRNPDGLRQLVELLESTPISRRQKMIDVGMQEDAEYTKEALKYVIVFEDIVALPDEELLAVLSEAPPRLTGYAIHSAAEETKKRFLEKSTPQASAEIREILETSNVTAIQISGGQLKLIEIARRLEKRGVVKTKKFPS